MTQTAQDTPIDPIDLEVLRTRLESIGEQACRTIESTAISPAITESQDYSITLCDAEGGLIIGSGHVIFHFGGAAHAVKSTIARYGDNIAPGDVFLANDPHNGGGLHPQDVMVQQPIFVDGTLVGWVGASAHLMDMGGMVIGSFAPDASECYQEAFRIPPVRLFRKGEEVTDVWDLLRTNVRMAELVEMDLRGLVAGAHSATERVQGVAAATGTDLFRRSLATIRDLSEKELRRRISLIEDGVYKATSWTEFDREFYEVPCTLTVDGDEMTFDFAGASPQCAHFINSKAYIVAAELMVMLQHQMAADLPFNEGLFAPVKILCPEGSVTNCRPPAPIGAAHMHVGLNAAGVGMQALTLAFGASPDVPQHKRLGGAGFESAIATQLWSWTDERGVLEAFLAMDANWAGSSAGSARDGGDLGRNPIGVASQGAYPDIEVLEGWFPLLFTERRARPTIEGAGFHRAGGGNQFSFQPHGVDHIDGTMFGMRRWMPLQGLAGGMPGACTELVIRRTDGSEELLPVQGSGHVCHAGERVSMRLANGGGYGDPLDRDPALVEADIAAGRFGVDEARALYGVIDGDAAATEATRAALRKDRLDRASPALAPVSRGMALAVVGGPDQPIYPGVVQRGGVAYAEASGAPLALAPDHWTDGCPMIEERRWAEDEPDVVYRSYLDPETGAVLHVEVSLAGSPRNFIVNPGRWSSIAQQTKVA